MQWPDPKYSYALNAPRGIRVFLNKSTWFDHICRGHAEMEKCLGEVLDTIDRPDEVYYYQKHRYSFKYFMTKGCYVMLIYKVSGNVGWVKTAYILPNPYVEVQGYNRVWPV